MATASGSESFTYPPTPPMGDMATRVSWDWNHTNGGSYSFVSLVENGLPDSLWTGYEEYDGFDASGLTSCEVWEDNYNVGLPANRYLIDIYPEFFSGFPWENGTLSKNINGNDLSRHSEVTILLKTGGKSGSKLKNLFGLQAGATGYSNFARDQYGDVYLVPSGAHTIDPSGIQVAGNPLNTNGVAYAIFPDNATVDITPKTSEDYYSFGVSATKYHSYYDLYVRQATKGFSFLPYGTNLVGHAFWKFSTDAPSDALQYISTNLTRYLGVSCGFFPINGLFTVPGIMEFGSENGTPDIHRRFGIGFPNMLEGLIYTKGIFDNPPVYVLSAFNCVGAARGAGFAADILGLPWDTSPQNFGVTLMQMYPPILSNDPFEDEADIFYSSAPY